MSSRPDVRAPDVELPVAAGARVVGAGEPARIVPLTDLAVELGLRRQAFTELVGERILSLFKISVISTVGLTIALALLDAWFIKSGVIEPDDRLVTEHVVMAIIGASIVQVGAASSAIAYSLFKQGKDNAGSADASTSALES